MTPHLPLRPLAKPLLLALATFALAAAALGPSGALAQTHRACSGVHARKAHGSCGKPSRKRASRHALKHRRKRSHAGTKAGGHSGAATTIFKPALCENGASPKLGANGSFSCEDESEPQCENGATPTISRNGKSLVCAVSVPTEAAEEAECEAEEPQASEDPSCAADASPGAAETSCEAASCENEE